MPAKTIQEAIKIGCKDLLADQQGVVNEIRDMVAHRVMILGETASAQDLFNDLFLKMPKTDE